MAESASIPDPPGIPPAETWVFHILQEIRGIHARLERMADRAQTHFRWTVGLVVVSWMTLVGVLLPPVLQLHAQYARLDATVSVMREDTGELKQDVGELKAASLRTQASIGALESAVRSAK